jgi:DNA-binding protein HU-beta
MPTRKQTTAPAKKAAARRKTITQTTITSKQIAIDMANEHDMQPKMAQRFVADFIDALRSYLIEGNKVRIAGLGIFAVRDRPARMGRNPSTGESIKIAASRKISVRIARDLKLAI